MRRRMLIPFLSRIDQLSGKLHPTAPALGLPDAEEHLVKAKLVWKIDAIMKER
jgi:hypothetical protein